MLHTCKHFKHLHDQKYIRNLTNILIVAKVGP